MTESGATYVTAGIGIVDYSLCSDYKVRDKYGAIKTPFSYFQDGLAYVEGTGKRVFIEPLAGGYDMTDFYEWTHDNPEIFGHPKYSIINRRKDNGSLLKFNCANPNLHDFKVDGKVGTYTNAANHAIEVDKGGNVIRNVSGVDNAGALLYGNNPVGVTGGWVDNIFVRNDTAGKSAGMKGIYLNDTADWEIGKGLIRDCEMGLDLDASAVELFGGLHVWGNTEGVVLARTASRNLISIGHVYVEGNDHNGIRNSDFGVSDLSIVRTQMKRNSVDHNNTYQDILLDAATYPFKICNVTFYGAAAAPQVKYCVSLHSTSLKHGLLKDCTFPPSDWVGTKPINVDARISNLLIKDNPRAYGANPNERMTFGVITNGWDNANHEIGYAGCFGAAGDGGPTAASTDYLVLCQDLTLRYAVGTGGGLTVKDCDGNTIANPGATSSTVFLRQGWKVSFGAFTGAPTCVITGS